MGGFAKTILASLMVMLTPLSIFNFNISTVEQIFLKSQKHKKNKNCKKNMSPYFNNDKNIPA